MSLMKLLPMVAFVGGGYATNDGVKAKVDKVINYTKVVAVQYEINNLSKMVYMDTLDNTQPTPDQFESYIHRSTLQKVNSGRDPSKDFWGSPYTLRYEESKKRFVITSAGPDMKFGTGDDVRGGYHY